MRSIPAPVRSTAAGIALVIIGSCLAEPPQIGEEAEGSPWHEPRGEGAASSSSNTLLQEQLSRVGVPFQPNEGQWPEAVAFHAQHFAGSLWVTREGELVHSLLGPALDEEAFDTGTFAEPAPPLQAAIGAKAVAPLDEGELARPRADGEPKARARGWTLVERFIGGQPDDPRGLEPQRTRVSYFLGNDRSQWVSGAATFEAVTLGEVWPGVEVRLQTRGSNVEKLFHVAPERDPSVIAMGLAGAIFWRLSDDGALVVRTGHGDIELSAPVAFQVIDGERRAVEVAYVVTREGYGFALGDYDPRHELVVDPLLQSTYLGGGGQDRPTAMTTDGSGHVLVAGFILGSGYPGTAGGAQATRGGGSFDVDMVVSRLSADLTTLLQSTYLGGSSTDQAFAVAVDSAGNVLVAGDTGSSNYPGTVGGARADMASASVEMVVSRLSADLTTLVQSTYMGGVGGDYARAITTDGAGNVLVAGHSTSTDFPGTAAGAQAANAGGDHDIVVSRLSADLTTLVQSTYLGGSGDDQGRAILLDGDGNVLVAGSSRSGLYPGTAGGAQAVKTGFGPDIVVSRLSADLTTLLQSTFLGGGGEEDASGIVRDAAGNVLVSGTSDSTDYPGTAGGARTAHSGYLDIVVSRLSADLTSLL